MIQELEIISYKILYKSLLPHAGKRTEVIDKLQSYLKEYKPFNTAMEESKHINIQSLKKVSSSIDYYVSHTFPAEFVKKLDTIPPATSTEPLIADGNAGALLLGAFKVILDLNRKYSESDITKHRYRYNYLLRALHSLVDYGLHPNIDKRDKQTHTRYNLIVEPKGRPELILTLISFDTLLNIFLVPLRKKQVMFINGARLLSSEIGNVTITSTLLKDDEIVFFKDKHNLRYERSFVRACQDETNDILREHIAILAPATTEKNKKTKRTTAEQKFISHLVEGIYQLQRSGKTLGFIKALQESEKFSEEGFCDWFRTWMAGRYKNAFSEVRKEHGRIDLQVSGEKIKTKIVEFKGWWNNDKNSLVKQVLSYLTDFEDTGFIFMINHLKSKDIITDYRNIMTSKTMYYIENSWTRVNHDLTSFCYFKSKYKPGIKKKTIYHFIFNVFSA